MENLGIVGAVVAGAIAFLVLIVWPAVRIVQQWERGVVLRFGRLIGIREPGLNVMFPWVDRMVKVDLRVETLVLEPQEIITRDNVRSRRSYGTFQIAIVRRILLNDRKLNRWFHNGCTAANRLKELPNILLR